MKNRVTIVRINETLVAKLSFSQCAWLEPVHFERMWKAIEMIKSMENQISEKR